MSDFCRSGWGHHHGRTFAGLGNGRGFHRRSTSISALLANAAGRGGSLIRLPPDLGGVWEQSSTDPLLITEGGAGSFVSSTFEGSGTDRDFVYIEFGCVMGG